MPICLRLFAHWMRAAASRTFWTAGSSSPIRMAMIAMTTSNSINVKAERGREDAGSERMRSPFWPGRAEEVDAGPDATGVRARGHEEDLPDAWNRSIAPAAQQAGLLAYGS